MHVLHVTPSVGPLRGGPSAALGVMTRALRAAGVQVDVATTNDNDTELLAVPIGEPVDENGTRYWYFERTAHPYTTSAGLARWLRANIAQYDVVHTHALFSFSTAIATAAARKKRVPYIVRPLGTLARYGMQQHSLLKQLSWFMLERRILRHAAAVHFTSQAEREEAERLGHWRSVVVPLGVPAPPEIRRPAPDPDEPVYLFLSRIHPKKRVELLLQAFWLVRESVPGARLVIAGQGPPAYVQELQKQCVDLGVAAHVQWLGHVDGVRKAELLRQVHVFVLPSVNENFGMAPVEAMAAGIPVVLTQGVAIHREVEAHGAGLIADETVATLADAMLELRRPEVQLAMSKQAVQLAHDHFSIEAMQHGLVQMYQKALAV